ncbi:hypothetical protein Thein_0460 [Thermodesulfatator indicus DSM 15286]|uniref:Uncharacterized protein n=1 Tax=Thermodesulfatator indicus (strain DSM 15286 / JCM 11887 / CIR29812) TaxID=667014 RepID=F8A869_THEID|nr:hypothetical protein Thein_0460 [Thermodesulfatator indicus DSM 15286]
MRDAFLLCKRLLRSLTLARNDELEKRARNDILSLSLRAERSSLIDRGHNTNRR